jgi:hypothetical protein
MAKAGSGVALNTVQARVRNEVITRGQGGAVLRRRRAARTAQPAAESERAPVMAAYSAMTRAQSRIWNAYAEAQTHHNGVTGAAHRRSGQNVFVGLSTTFVQVNPGSTIPLVPPTVPFAGDNVVLTASAGSGAILLTASGPNAAPAKTEILLQPVTTVHRVPARRYESVAFVAFAAGSLAYSVPAAPGRYACAYRFVNAATGQATEMVEIGVVQVG